MPRGIPKNGTNNGWFKKGISKPSGMLGKKHSEETKGKMRSVCNKFHFQKGNKPIAGFKKGHSVYNGAEKGWIKKGQHYSSKTEFKKEE